MVRSELSPAVGSPDHSATRATTSLCRKEPQSPSVIEARKTDGASPENPAATSRGSRSVMYPR